MKKLLAVIVGTLALVSQAEEIIIPDQIRGGINQIILKADNNDNYMIVIFIKEKLVDLRPISKERVIGFPITNPKAFGWPVLTSVKYSIRFDPDLPKILSNPNFANSPIYKRWPPCLQDSCPNGVPKIQENQTGVVDIVNETDNQWLLSLAKGSKQFNDFFETYRESSRIVIEFNGNRQVVFSPVFNR